MRLVDYIKDVPNFPKEGILFKDITPLLADEYAFSEVSDIMANYLNTKKADIVVGPESRGFIFGCAAAAKAHKGFVPVRKPGKLPREVIKESYDTEYSKDTLEMHKDAIKPGQRVVIIDDLIATGGTLKAIVNMIEKAGGIVVGICCLIELKDLNGADALKGYEVYSLIHY